MLRSVHSSRSFLAVLLSASLLTLFLAACASATKGSSSRAAARVTFRQYRDDVELTIVNESHTDRVEQYSKRTEDASVKVASDEVMDALLELVRPLEARMQTGPAPQSANEPLLETFELEDARGVRHAVLAAGDQSPGAQAFRSLRGNFIVLYNNIYAAQSVEDPTIFDDLGGR